MSQLLTQKVARAPLHLIIESQSDLPVVEMVLAALRERGIDPPLHVLSCYRDLESLSIFAREFQGKAVICIGGGIFALPGILDGLWLDFCTHVEVWGLPTGDSPFQRELAVSAMRFPPPPCHVLCQHDHNEACISQMVEEVVAYIRGEKIPEGASEEEWQERVKLQHSRRAVINWKPGKEG